MYIALKTGNFIVRQPNENLLSYKLNNKYMRIGINNSAFEVIQKLNGTKMENQIIDDLSIKYNEKREAIKEMVKPFIQLLKDSKLLDFLENPKERNVVRGDLEYYTPEHITIELTHKCPLKCKHCFVNAGNGITIDYSKSKNLLINFLNFGVNIFQLTGGEPFLFKQIKEYILMIVEQERAVHITTSGFLYSKNIQECLDIMSQSKLSKIQISLDGLEKRHNEIRGSSESYEKAIFFIKQCISRNIFTSVATSLINQDLYEIEKLTILLKDMGVKEHRLGLIINQGRAQENKLKGYSYDEYKEILSYLKNKYDSNLFIVKESEDINSHENCGAGYKTLKIKPSLMITPCAMMQFNIGNLNNEEIVTILKRNYKRFSLIEYPSSKHCSNCSEENYCKGCISEAIIRKNNVNKCSWELSQKKLLYT